jgi:hypothetical protein
MVTEVGRAGGGLTGVFTIDAQVTDIASATLVDTLGSQLMTQLGDSRIDPTAPTYERLGQVVGLAVGTPTVGGLRVDASGATIRDALSTGGLMTSDPDARLAELLLVLLPDAEDLDEDERLAQVTIYTAMLTGLADTVKGVVALADSASAETGLMAELRTDALLTGSVSTVGGAEVSAGRAIAMMALIAALQGSPGSYGASGAELLPAVP